METTQAPARAVDLRVLEALTEATGAEFDPVLAREALHEAARRGAAPMEALAAAAGQLGLRLTLSEWPIRQALGCLGPGHALVAPGADDWVVVVERRGRGARLADGSWVSENDLARRVAGNGTAAVWGLVRPLAPCDHVSDPPDDGGHGHHGHGHGPSPLRRLIGLLRPEARDLWVVVVFAIGVGILSLAVPITVEALVSTVQGGNVAMFQAVIVLALILLFCLGLAGAMRALKTYLVELMQRRLFVRVVADLAYRLPRVRAAAFDGQHGPELVNRFFDVMTVQKAGGTLLLDGVVVILQAAIGLFVLAIWHPYLLGFNIALLVSFLFLVYVLGRGAISAKIEESYAKYAVAGWLEEMARHPLAFKLSAAQDYALERADALSRRYLLTRRDSFHILFRQIVFGIALQALASAALLGLGGWLVIGNELTIGQLVAAELIVVVIVGSFVKLGKSLESYYDLLAAVDKLGHLIDLPLERDEGEGLYGADGPAALTLRDVSFAYEDGPTVIHHLHASIRPGERVALVGPSGAGKSTLVEMLYGLREPTGGHIELDGVDVRDLRLDELREQVVSVAGAEVFEGTIVDNVRLGRPGIGLAEVRDALRMAGLLEDVRALAQGLHTPLATGGAPLSRGQIQRLMLARAVAGRPRLLILDETLDQMDALVRRQVLPELFHPGAPWTILVVTHDPEVLTSCNRRLELPRHTPVQRHDFEEDHR